jgi:hypothetical protein
MKIICSWCRQEGKAALVGEKAPLDDARETHGICVVHRRTVEARIRTPLHTVSHSGVSTRLSFSSFRKWRGVFERDQEDAPLGEAHLLVDSSEGPLPITPETF